MTAPDLLPCPFCGGVPVVKSGGPGCAYVKCCDCPAETGDGPLPKIIAAWNRRATSDDALERAARKAARSLREIAGMDMIGASAVAFNAARELEAALKSAADDDPPCTCCGGSGVTFQTERPCSCIAPTPTPLAAALEVPEVRDMMVLLAWYGEQARLARLIHSEGDMGRHALQADGGKKAKAALAALKGGAE